MGRNSLSAGDSASDDAPAATFHSIRDRFPFKRYNNASNTVELPRSSKTTTSALKTSRSHHHKQRKLSLYPFKGKSRLYMCIFSVFFIFLVASMVLQSSIMLVFRQGVGGDRMRWRWSDKKGLELGSSLQFFPRRQLQLNGDRLDSLRSQPRIGVRPPRIALILGNMKKDPSALLLYSLMKNLKGLGYLFKLYALKDGRARSVWQDLGGPVSILWPERYGYVDWSIYEGVVADSLEAKPAISRSLFALCL